jgi:hypothetical protein
MHDHDIDIYVVDLNTASCLNDFPSNICSFVVHTYKYAEPSNGSSMSPATRPETSI